MLCSVTKRMREKERNEITKHKICISPALNTATAGTGPNELENFLLGITNLIKGSAVHDAMKDALGSDSRSILKIILTGVIPGIGTRHTEGTIKGTNTSCAERLVGDDRLK
mmetsp:Transcript_15495/g.31348  ORF Transcript_15495/g.31348 Transcript_15495/m.31348 type:complete len:111 (-) Transcript_15495:176-508(-)